MADCAETEIGDIIQIRGSDNVFLSVDASEAVVWEVPRHDLDSPINFDRLIFVFVFVFSK